MRSQKSFCLTFPLMTLLFGSLFLQGCGLETLPQDSKPFVVRGVEMSELETASMGLVALLVDPTRSDRRGVCTGVLVGPRTVLSAAHCLANPLGAPTTVAFGTDAFLAKQIRIKSVQRHPSGDIMRVELSEDAPRPWKTQDILRDVPRGFVGKTAFTAGFGRNATNAPLTSGRARSGSARVTAFEVGMPIITVSSGSGAGLCFGDSGGPLFFTIGGELKVAGILSQGSSTCETGLDTYTSVPFYHRWLGSW